VPRSVAHRRGDPTILDDCPDHDLRVVVGAQTGALRRAVRGSAGLETDWHDRLALLHVLKVGQPPVAGGVGPLTETNHVLVHLLRVQREALLLVDLADL